MGAMDTMLRLIISGDSSGAQKAIAAVRGEAGKLGGALDQPSQKLGEMGSKMSGVGQKMTMGLTLPILAIGAASVSSFAKFETSMNQVQSATGASSAELQKMSDYAKKMGADTVFSAGEAAGAMLELAKSGMTPAQIQAGGLKATMDLAAAGELALADAAIVTSSAMNTFGLEAKDAASIAAALAGGANASSANVSDLALALSQVGPGAKNAGMSLQETVGVLAAFADNGIRGSDAGTSLKTMLQNLIPQTDKAAVVMKKLGLSFVDSAGNIDDISTVAEKLKDKLGGLTEAQRMQALQTMFGSDATRAATVLMNEGAEGLAEYMKATNDQSAATDMATARMKGLGGALENMKGSLESAGISIGQVLAPAVTKVAGGIKWLADLVSGMPGPLRNIVVGVGLLVAAFGPLLVITGKVLSGFQAIRNFSFKRQVAAGVGGVPAAGGGVPTAGGGAAGTAGVTQLGRSSAVSATQVSTLGRAAVGASGGTASLGNKARTAAPSVGALGSKAGGTVVPLGQLSNRAAGAAPSVGTLGNRAGSAAPSVQSLGNRARTAAPQISVLGTASGRTRGAMGKLSGAMDGPAGSIAMSIAFSAALGFAITKLSELGSAINQAADSTDNAKTEEANALALANKRLKELAANPKYGKDSQAYKDMLEIIRQIKRDGINENTSWLMKSFLRTFGDLKGIWNGIFGGGQAAGGDYMVTSPTLFLAGDAGPERATFTPKGKAGARSGGNTYVTVHIATLNGTDEQAARMVAGRVGAILAQQQRLHAATGF